MLDFGVICYAAIDITYNLFSFNDKAARTGHFHQPSVWLPHPHHSLLFLSPELISELTRGPSKTLSHISAMTSCLRWAQSWHRTQPAQGRKKPFSTFASCPVPGGQVWWPTKQALFILHVCVFATSRKPQRMEQFVIWKNSGSQIFKGNEGNTFNEGYCVHKQTRARSGACCIPVL